MRFLVRMLLMPVRFVLAAMAVGVRVVELVVRVPMRIAGRVGRLLGPRAVVALVVGLVVGVLFAPGPGRELRDRLRALATNRGTGGDLGLAERVAFELQHAPRTWHLPQPAVAASAGEITLVGRVDQDAARDELGRVAAAVPGVVRVENLIDLSTAAEAGPA